jgi:hypothetical protein
VRTALGSSRRRILLQLLFEALVLSALAAAVGTAIAAAALRQANMLELGTDGLPFWMEFGLSSGTVVYVMCLAVVAATIIGVIPALEITGRDVEPSLRAAGPRTTGMALGRSWTTLIVGQVAMAATILPLAGFTLRQTGRNTISKPGFATEEYVSAPMYLDLDRRGALGPEDETRYADLQAEVLRRLDVEPWIRDTLVAGTIPGQAVRGQVVVERDDRADRSGPREAGANGHAVALNRVARGFFAAFEVPFLAGREFAPGDLVTPARTVIVNRSFAREASAQVTSSAVVSARRMTIPGHPESPSRSSGTD